MTTPKSEAANHLTQALRHLTLAHKSIWDELTYPTNTINLTPANNPLKHAHICLNHVESAIKLLEEDKTQ